MKAQFSCQYCIGDAVTIDHDDSLIGNVTAVMFYRPDFVKYQVSYIHNGDAKEAWVDEFRIKSVRS